MGYVDHKFFPFLFCEVGGLVIIHKKIPSNLAIGQRRCLKNLQFLLCLGGMLELKCLHMANLVFFLEIWYFNHKTLCRILPILFLLSSGKIC